MICVRASCYVSARLRAFVSSSWPVLVRKLECIVQLRFERDCVMTACSRLRLMKTVFSLPAS